MPVTLRPAARRGHRNWRGLHCVPALAIAGFTRSVRWPLILPAPRLAAEFSRAEGITIKMVIRPPICTQTMREIAANPAPAQVKAAVAAAVENHAVPAARLDDFTRSMRTALWWQLGVFALALILSARLPG